MIKYLILLFCFFSFGCFEKSLPLPTESTVFTSSELSELRSLLIKFNSLNPEDNYPELLGLIKSELENTGSPSIYSRSDVDILFSELSQSTKHKIWKFDTIVNKRRIPYSMPPAHSADTIGIKVMTYDTPYFEFLNEVEKDDSQIKHYTNIIRSHGFNSIRETHELFLNYDDYDFNNELHKLIFTLRILTLNDISLIHKESYESLMTDISLKFEQRREI